MTLVQHAAIALHDYTSCPRRRRWLSWIPLSIAVLLWCGILLFAQHEQNLHRRREFVRDLLAKAYDTGETAVIVADEGHQIVSSSAVSERLFGRDLVGTDLLHLWSRNVRDTVEDSYEAILRPDASQTVLRLEGQMAMRGTSVTMQIVLRPVVSDGKRLVVVTLLPLVTPTISLESRPSPLESMAAPASASTEN